MSWVKIIQQVVIITIDNTAKPALIWLNYAMYNMISVVCALNWARCRPGICAYIYKQQRSYRRLHTFLFFFLLTPFTFLIIFSTWLAFWQDWALALAYKPHRVPRNDGAAMQWTNAVSVCLCLCDIFRQLLRHAIWSRPRIFCCNIASIMQENCRWTAWRHSPPAVLRATTNFYVILTTICFAATATTDACIIKRWTDAAHETDRRTRTDGQTTGNASIYDHAVSSLPMKRTPACTARGCLPLAGPPSWLSSGAMRA